MVSVQLKGKIVPIGQDMGWLDARNAVKDKGGLPSNVLHDQYLVGSERYTELPRNYYAAWAREVLVYPANGKAFRKGKDVIDAIKDNQGREWVFPASSMPEQAVGRKNVGLFIDPEQVEVSDMRVVVLAQPKSIIILGLSPELGSFIQESGTAGKVDETTGIPLEVSQKLFDKLDDKQKRWLYRIDDAGVRPLARDDLKNGYDRSGVGAGRGRDVGYGVAYVEATEGGALRNVEIVRPAETTGFAYRSAPAEVRSPSISLSGSVYDAAVTECERLGEILQPTQLVAIRTLLDSLAIKG